MAKRRFRGMRLWKKPHVVADPEKRFKSGQSVTHADYEAQEAKNAERRQKTEAWLREHGYLK